MLFGMKAKTDPDADQHEDFPILMMEPWRAAELLASETKKQRYRLFRAVCLARLIFVVLGIIMFALDDNLGFENIVLVGCYSALVILLYFHAVLYQNDVDNHSFFIGLFDVFLVGYLFIISTDKLELSFIFFSILLSAALLPMSRVIIIVGSAYILITFGWLDAATDLFHSIFSVSEIVHWNLLLEHFLGRKSQETLVLILGFLFLAFIVNRLAVWSFTNEVRASFRYKQMRQVLAYNRAVIEHLKTGVITLNTEGKIISINRHAINLLNIKTEEPITEIQGLSVALTKRYKAWLSEGKENAGSYRHNANAEEVMIHFSQFKGSKDMVMMSLDSVNESFQQANEAKLSALGRLTAGIAHEIRNPLASISSAAQLLNEDATDERKKRLSRLILSNIQRTNQIINDVLSLFKEADPSRVQIDLNRALKRFCREFSDSHKDSRYSLRLVSPLTDPVYVMFDTGQFNQVLWNICFNALKYSQQTNLVITLSYRLSADKRMLLIDIIDNGVGVPEEKQDYLFEPFYTGSSSGSGLGLYLVRELCGANNANITYVPLMERNPESSVYTTGAQFRLTMQAYFSQKTKPTLRER